MVKHFFTQGSSQTKKLGRELAKKILKAKPKKISLILALEGELGAGKTTFLKGFAKGLGVKGNILSPTFIIIKKFNTRVKSSSNSGKFRYFYHLDCYRLKKPKEILALGFQKIISNHENIIAIEWAERARPIIPKSALWIKFKFIDKNKRKIVLK